MFQHASTVADPGKMKGGVQINERAARVVKVARSAIFLGYAHFRSHMAREIPYSARGSPIIDLRRAS